MESRENIHYVDSREVDYFLIDREIREIKDFKIEEKIDSDILPLVITMKSSNNMEERKIETKRTKKTWIWNKEREEEFKKGDISG